MRLSTVVLAHIDSAGVERFLLVKTGAPGQWRMPSVVAAAAHQAVSSLSATLVPAEVDVLELVGAYVGGDSDHQHILAVTSPRRFDPVTTDGARWVTRTELSAMAVPGLADLLACHDVSQIFRKFPAEYRRLGGDYLRQARWVRNQLPRSPEWNEIPVPGLVALRGYALGDYHHDLNEALRSGDAARIRRYEPVVSVMVETLRLLPRYVGHASRVITIDEPDTVMDRYQAGICVVEPAFVSAQMLVSTDTPGSSFVGNVAFEIESHTGRAIDALSPHNEGEVLFAPGSAFVVVGCERDASDGWVVGLRDVSGYR